MVIGQIKNLKGILKMKSEYTSIIVSPDQARRNQEQRAANALISKNTVCTKYQLVSVIKEQYPELYTKLYDAYCSNEQLKFYWNTVQELNMENEDFKNFVSTLEIPMELVEEIFRKAANY